MPANKIGKDFERQVANDIRRAFKATNKDCFRTPMSGGHHALPGVDIQLSPELFLKFPWAIECKNDRRFRFGQWMNPTGFLRACLNQVEKAAKDLEANPLLITNEKHIGVFCAVRDGDVPKGYLDHASAVLSCSVGKQVWVVSHWGEFLAFAVARAAGKERRKR